MSYMQVQVKQANYRPGHSVKFQGVGDFKISKQSAHESSKVVSPTHRPHFPPGNIPGTNFC